MDLNKIELTGEIVGELFKNSLVDTSSEPERKTPDAFTKPLNAESKTQNAESKIKNKQSSGDIKFLGGNDKNILVLVNYPIPGYLPDDQLNFLISILNACKINLQDVAIVNQHQNKECGYDEFTGQMKPKIILLFAIDIAAMQMPFRIPDFQVQDFNKSTYLLSPSLEELQAEKELKIKLWNCLQRIFL
jgi:hypothetical protein